MLGFPPHSCWAGRSPPGTGRPTSRLMGSPLRKEVLTSVRGGGGCSSASGNAGREKASSADLQHPHKRIISASPKAKGPSPVPSDPDISPFAAMQQAPLPGEARDK